MITKSRIFILLMLILLLIFFGCLDKRKNYLNTKKIDDNLFVEYFESWQGGTGFLSGSLTSAFLTDSSNYNQFICSMEDDENIEFIKKQNILICLKYMYIFTGYNKRAKKKYLEIIAFDIKTGEKL